MKYKIAIFPGDGVGPELINEGIKIIDKAAELGKFEVEWAKYPHGAEHYLETKELLSDKTLKEIKNSRTGSFPVRCVVAQALFRERERFRDQIEKVVA